MIFCEFENCPDVALYKVAFDRGCVCFPQARVMNLCLQHYHRASPLGTMWMLEEYGTFVESKPKRPPRRHPRTHRVLEFLRKERRITR